MGAHARASIGRASDDDVDGDNPRGWRIIPERMGVIEAKLPATMSNHQKLFSHFLGRENGVKKK